MKTVAIIGGGIAGLTAAYRLINEGVAVTLFESSGRVGGAIRTERTRGYLVELGPNTIQTKTALLDELVEELGLANERLYAGETAKKRFVVRNNEPVPIPTSPPAFLRTPLFSTGAKLRLLREPFIGAVNEQKEESVAEFVERRLGTEFLDYAINPFVAGVFAGDPTRLSLRHAFPRMFTLEQQYGSLIKGMIRISRERKRAASPMPAGRLLSFKDGLQVLPEAIGKHLGNRIHLNTHVNGVIRDENCWRIEVSGGNGNNMHSFDAVLYAAPLYHLPSLRLELNHDLSLLNSVFYPPLSVVALGFRREQVSHPLDGFGMLVPAVERRYKILGTLFSSSLFPGRAPEDHVLLTSFVGGVRNPRLASASTETIRDTVLSDLRDLLGIRGEPDFLRHEFWERAIPQYHVGYGQIKSLLDQIETQNQGFFFTGNYREGISVSDTITAASSIATRIKAWLEP